MPETRALRFIVAFIASFGLFCTVTISELLRGIILSYSMKHSLKRFYIPDNTTHANFTGEEKFTWKKEFEIWVLPSMAIASIFSSLPGGIIADLYGVRIMMGVSGICVAACAFVIPQVNSIPYVLWGLALLIGFVQGPIFPAMSVLAARWSAPSERATYVALLIIGPVLSFLIAELCSDIDVGLVDSMLFLFYVFGALNLVWSLIWICFFSSNPEDSKYITNSERYYITSSVSNEIGEEIGDIPWKAIFSSVPLLTLSLGYFGAEWCLYALRTQMYPYLSRTLNIPAKDQTSSVVCWLFCGASALVGGIVSDHLIKRRIFSKRAVRKAIGGIASIGPAVIIVLLSYSNRDLSLVNLYLSLITMFLGLSTTSVQIVNIDIAPNFAGITMGIMYTASNFADIVVTSLFRNLVHQGGTIVKFRIGFWMTGAVLIESIVPFLLFGTTAIQSWNYGIIRGPRPAEEPQPTREDSPVTLTSGKD